MADRTRRSSPRWLILIAMLGGCAAAAGLLAFLLLPRGSLAAARYAANGIRIGYAIEAPFAFLSSTGAVTGESPETARRIAARLGIRRVEWRQMDFNDLIPALEAQRIDVIAAGLFITPERQARVAFSIPTFRVTQGLLVAAGNPRGLHAYEDAVAALARIAVLSGSVEEAWFLRSGMPPASLLAVPDALTGRVAVESGAADGLALSAPTVRWIAGSGGRSAAALPFRQPGGAAASFGGFAFRKADTGLRQAWDGALRAFLGGAEHRAVLSAFGFTAEELP
jgi:polar amino acid transport system substrate-binding protein